ncbi:uncharacterized protein STEHIDRAFT_115575 [Stereum hirsutum FP-91666 SS1]|uniref:uncharacterized protein n=1 Tax=Stereum hirsutum (strain FP-91666) TaxID=721885 RepID=UPI0004449713|nr:uncharacterized protein STEHIDRAFT_115575 [Stereum hirsutum FP-91666 SS1]EIM80712.1 hypothetical protein STEHIDRAFT_115575 [Stereum hirsutum FP-91666 SS1]
MTSQRRALPFEMSISDDECNTLATPVSPFNTRYASPSKRQPSASETFRGNSIASDILLSCRAPTPIRARSPFIRAARSTLSALQAIPHAVIPGSSRINKDRSRHSSGSASLSSDSESDLLLSHRSSSASSSSLSSVSPYIDEDDIVVLDKATLKEDAELSKTHMAADISDTLFHPTPALPLSASTSRFFSPEAEPHASADHILRREESCSTLRTFSGSSDIQLSASRPLPTPPDVSTPAVGSLGPDSDNYRRDFPLSLHAYGYTDNFSWSGSGAGSAASVSSKSQDSFLSDDPSLPAPAPRKRSRSISRVVKRVCSPAPRDCPTPKPKERTMSPRNVPLPQSRATSPETTARVSSRADPASGRVMATEASVDQWTALLDGILKATGTTYSSPLPIDPVATPVSKSKRIHSRPVTPTSAPRSRNAPRSRATTPVQRAITPAAKVVMSLEAMMKPLIAPERDPTEGINGEMTVTVSTETEVRNDRNEILNAGNAPTDDKWAHLVVEDKM